MQGEVIVASERLPGVRRLLTLTLLHPLVDVCTASLFMFAAADVWQMFLYNFVAFALQLPLGWALDWERFPLRGLLLAAAGFLVCGIAVFAVFAEPVVAIALASFGNALFHIAAGKRVLEESEGRATRVSVFISTGGIGLLIGMRFGAQLPLPLIVGPVVVYLAALFASWKALGADAAPSPRELPVPCLRGDVALVIVLAALVVWRSYAVLTATGVFSSAWRAVPFVVALAGSSWLGQALSGWLSDRFGPLKVLGASLAGSAALAWMCPETCVGGYLALMCVAQLSTGPVLTLLYRSCRGRAGLAFGVNCLALFASTLFLHCPERVLFYFAGDFLAVALEFAATAWVRLPRWFMALVTVNLCTHPALTYAVSRLGRTPAVIIVGETLVVLVETGLLKLLYRRQAVSTGRFFLIALWMNAVSYLVGVCLFGV